MQRATIPLRPTQVAAFGGMAVTPHHLSTQAALVLLERGGNAVDAAIAANAVQGVVAPETCGLGGDLFALVALPDHAAPLALNSSGRAGAGAARLAHDLRRSGADAIPQMHPAAVTVPGCVDGWLTMSGRLGRLGLAASLEPAIRLAREGFPANRELAAALAARQQDLAEAGGEIYPKGEPPREGDRIRRPTLAGTLERIASDGRRAFYAGDVAEALSRAVAGAITADDLARPQADWVDAVHVDVWGRRGWTMPPNSQGYIALLALAVVERVGMTEPDDPSGWHLAVEAYRLAAEDRDEVLADPDNMTLPPADLLSLERIESLADRFDPASVAELPLARPATGGTAYMCALDESGMGVSLIQSNFHGIGSGLAVPPGGFFLHDRGRGFTLRRGHPNELAPGRRPLHTLSPTLWTDGHRIRTLLGTRGGFMQPQLVEQMALSLIAYSLDPATAQAVPRWMVPPSERGADRHLEVEPGTPEAVVSHLERRGHRVRRHDLPQSGWGPVAAINHLGSGLMRGAADPRVDTATAGGR